MIEMGMKMSNKDSLVDAIDALEYKIHVAVDILNKIDKLGDVELRDMVKLINDSSLTIDVLNFQLTRNIVIANNKDKLEEVFQIG